MRARRKTMEVVAVALLAALLLSACERARLNNSTGAVVTEGAVSATPTMTATIAPTGEVTPSAEPVVTKAGEPTPTAEVLPDGTVWPEYGRYTPTAFANVQGMVGYLGEDSYFRTGPGRTYKRLLLLSYSSRVMITEMVVSDFNEMWYKVAVIINDAVYYGYVQASSVDLEHIRKAEEKPRLQASGMDFSQYYGSDKDGDGVYVVVLDPGHGGPFKGASYQGYTEKECNLTVAKACKRYLESHFENVVVYLTRSTDYIFDPSEDVDDLEYRVIFAREHEADILVSLHFDGYNGRTAGAEGLVQTNEKLAAKSRSLASFILRRLERLGITNLETMYKWSDRSRYRYPDGAKMDGYLINRLSGEVGIVSCIIENAHIDNDYDFYNFIKKEGMLEKLGEADAEGIAEFLLLTRKAVVGTPTPTPTPGPTEAPAEQ
ncbi:MAG: N-acetylmuramoyl-L-alanine amidase [Lachnospiraceae bacterium]|nr:N-acetylmuramoyl-L-alanine amidase [Lachnospiraceae bacterium]